MMFNLTTNEIKIVFYKAWAVLAGVVVVFVTFEPIVTRSATTASDDFTVQQEILAEISLILGTTTVTMTGSLGGITGGTATGTNYAVVRANSGYIMTLAFENNPALVGDTTSSTGIVDYTPAGAEPDYNFVSGSSAVFAYTVASQPEADLDPSFKDAAGACGSGSYTANKCWQGPSTDPYTVINRSTNTGTGTGAATTTFTFVIEVPNNPSPAVPADFYTATATLTATIQ